MKIMDDFALVYLKELKSEYKKLINILQAINYIKKLI